MYAYLTYLLLFATLHLMVQCELDDEERTWQKWKIDYPQVHIGRDEEDVRRSIFHDTYVLVNDQKKKFATGNISYDVSLNEFAALSPREREKLLGFNASLKVIAPSYDVPENDTPALTAPSSLDWRTSGAVTPVKNQGQCGSCWAFSATGAIESRIFIKTKRLVSLSEQNLIDCTSDIGNNGCDGGVMDLAFSYVQKSGGLNTASAYPYSGTDSNSCRFKKATATSRVISYRDISAGNENALLQAVASGPVAVAFEVTDAFYNYRSGIYSDQSCGRDINHAVLVVGYGPGYWLVKNSWGTSWGERGYFRIARGSNMCGITDMASYPVV